MLTLDEAAYKNLRERAYNMHKLMKYDGRGGTAVEHFMAVRALLAVMEEHMRQQHGDDAEGIMDHVEEWMQGMYEEGEEPAQRTSAMRPPPSDISIIGKCMSPDCSASSRDSFCTRHGGRS